MHSIKGVVSLVLLYSSMFPFLLVSSGLKMEKYSVIGDSLKGNNYTLCQSRPIPQREREREKEMNWKVREGGSGEG